MKNAKKILIPSFINNLGNYTVSGTTLNSIFNEFNSKYNKSISYILTIKKSANGIKDNINNIESIIDVLINRLDTVQNYIDFISGSSLKNYLIFQREVLKNYSFSMVLLLGLFIFFNLINLLIMYLFLIKKYQLIRYIAHLSWLFLLIISIAGFLLAGIIGFAGALTRDLVPTFNFIFSEENLMNRTIFISDKDTAETVNICLNYGGDIANELFGIEISDVDNVAKFYNQTGNINKYLAKFAISSNIKTDSEEIANFIRILNNTANDINLLIRNTSDTNSPTSIMNEMRKWTDYTFGSSFQLNCNGTMSMDMWSQSVDSCDANYTYLKIINNTGLVNSQLGKPNCLIWNEWTNSYIGNRYGSITNCTQLPNKTNEFSSVQSAVIAYWQALNTLNVDNKNLINKLINELINLNTKFATSGSESIKLLSKINSLGYPLYNLVNSTIGEGSSFYDLVNCGNLNKDLYMVLANIKDSVSPKSIATSGIIFIISLANVISVLSLQLIIYKNIEKQRNYSALKNEEKDKMDTGIRNEKNVELAREKGQLVIN
jgi:hypothetical protein